MIAQVPRGWIDNHIVSPEDARWLCCDCVVGIADPIRADVVEAVQTARAAGTTEQFHVTHWPFCLMISCVRCDGANGYRRQRGDSASCCSRVWDLDGGGRGDGGATVQADVSRSGTNELLPLMCLCK